jgi:hypothetical protein
MQTFENRPDIVVRQASYRLSTIAAADAMTTMVGRKTAGAARTRTFPMSGRTLEVATGRR